MICKSVALGLTLAAALSLPALAAGPANPGFETGDLTGWTAAGGPVDVVTDTFDFYGGTFLETQFLPTEGGYFARLTASDPANAYTTLSQGFSLDALSRVSFDAAFLAFDESSFNDDAYVKIFDAADHEVFAFTSDVGAVGDYGHTPWTSFTSGRLAVGAYRLEAGVRNVDDPDSRYSSQLLLDNVSVSAATVPEPATWGLMILGFGGLGMALRRRRAALAV